MKSRFLLAFVGVAALGWLTLQADEPNKASKEDGAKIQAELARAELVLGSQFKEFELSLLKLMNRLEKSSKREDQDKAALLARALEKAKNAAIGAKFDQLVDMINKKSFSNPTDLAELDAQTKNLHSQIQEILKILREDSKTLRNKEEKARLEELLKRLEKVIHDQKVVQANTEAGRAKPEDQNKVTDATKNLINDANKGEAKDTKGQAKDGKESGKGKPGEAKDAGKTGDAQKAQGKDGGDKKDPKDGKPAEAKGGDPKAGDPKSGDPKAGKGDPKQGEAKAGDPKSAEAKAGAKDAKPGSEAKPGDAKPGGQQGGEQKKAEAKDGGKENKDPKAGGMKEKAEAKGGDPKKEAGKPDPKQAEAKAGDPKSAESKAGAKDAKPGDSKPGDAKPGQAKDGEAKPGQAKPGDAKAGQSQSKPGDQPKEAKQNDDPKKPPQQANDQKQPEQIGKKQIEDAQYPQNEAAKKIGKDNKEAADKQEEALQKLAEAKKKLEDLLNQLREEELERTLADLQRRCIKMRDMQISVLHGTQKIFKNVQATADKQPTRDHKIESFKLSDDKDVGEKAIVAEADKAIEIIRSEGSAVAFPVVFEQVREDMSHVQRRLAIADVGSVTQGIEQDIIDTLKEMIEALAKAEKEMKDKKDKKKDQKQKEPDKNKQAQDQKLLEKIAELKMIKSMQLRINARTKVYAQEYTGEQANEPRIQAELRELASRQVRITDVTKKLAKGDNK